MFLKRLQLTNYRNYASLDLEFKTPLTILVGNNAEGKSNLLESIYFLATTKSLKADEDNELIAYGKDFTRVAGEVLISNPSTVYRLPPDTSNSQPLDSRLSTLDSRLEIAMQLNQDPTLIKRVKINGLLKRIVDYIGSLYVVSFSPEDINLVIGSPSLRRWHIDLTLAQVDREYKKALTTYTDVVIRKNRVLKRIRERLSQTDELDYWADQQIIFGELVSGKRRDFFSYLNSTEKTFPPVNGTIEYQYLENPISKDRLDAYQDKEIWNAASLIGPHRDDFRFISRNSLNQTRDLSNFGSRGEQRTAILDLKLSEVSFIEKVTGSRPVLLLDDVFSELDDKHRHHVTQLLDKQQTILATVELDESLIKKLGNNPITFFSVENGQLTVITDK